MLTSEWTKTTVTPIALENSGSTHLIHFENHGKKKWIKVKKSITVLETQKLSYFQK